MPQQVVQCRGSPSPVKERKIQVASCGDVAPRVYLERVQQVAHRDDAIRQDDGEAADSAVHNKRAVTCAVVQRSNALCDVKQKKLVSCVSREF